MRRINKTLKNIENSNIKTQNVFYQDIGTFLLNSFIYSILIFSLTEFLIFIFNFPLVVSLIKNLELDKLLNDFLLTVNLTPIKEYLWLAFYIFSAFFVGGLHSLIFYKRLNSKTVFTACIMLSLIKYLTLSASSYGLLASFLYFIDSFKTFSKEFVLVFSFSLPSLLIGSEVLFLWVSNHDNDSFFDLYMSRKRGDDELKTDTTTQTEAERISTIQNHFNALREKKVLSLTPILYGVLIFILSEIVIRTFSQESFQSTLSTNPLFVNFYNPEVIENFKYFFFLLPFGLFSIALSAVNNYYSNEVFDLKNNFKICLTISLLKLISYAIPYGFLPFVIHFFGFLHKFSLLPLLIIPICLFSLFIGSLIGSTLVKKHAAKQFQKQHDSYIKNKKKEMAKLKAKREKSFFENPLIYAIFIFVFAEIINYFINQNETKELITNFISSHGWDFLTKYLNVFPFIIAALAIGAMHTFLIGEQINLKYNFLTALFASLSKLISFCIPYGFTAIFYYFNDFIQKFYFEPMIIIPFCILGMFIGSNIIYLSLSEKHKL